MNSQKENFLARGGISSLLLKRNTFSLLVAACLSGCTTTTWITMDYSGPIFPYESLADLGKKHQNVPQGDMYHLEKFGQFIGDKKRGVDEFVDDNGKIFNRQQLESGNQ